MKNPQISPKNLQNIFKELIAEKFKAQKSGKDLVDFLASISERCCGKERKKTFADNTQTENHETAGSRNS